MLKEEREKPKDNGKSKREKGKAKSQRTMGKGMVIPDNKTVNCRAQHDAPVASTTAN
jgi:ribosomal protein S26